MNEALKKMNQMWFLPSSGSSGNGRRARHLILRSQHTETRAKEGGPNGKQRKRVIHSKVRGYSVWVLKKDTPAHHTCREVRYQSWHYRLTAQHSPGAPSNTAWLDHGTVAKTLGTSAWLYFPGQPSQQSSLCLFTCLGVSFSLRTVQLFSILKEWMFCLIK